MVPPPMSTTIEPDGSAIGRRADGGRHGLLDRVGAAGAGVIGGLLDGAALDRCYARGNADDDARAGPLAVVDLLDEVPQHLLGYVEVGDDPVAEGSDGRDVGGGAADHPLRLHAHG